jgi:uncharacterized protein YndB with AHSA1/START domain
MTPPLLEKVVLVEASTEEVWRAWTTLEGVKRFFAPKARLDITPNGAYEILFDPEEAPGRRGSEGSRVLSFVPNMMLSFTWGAPPEFAKSRKELAQWVVLLFEPAGERKTLVRLLELGWKQGKEGEQVYRYFDRAWQMVLERLAYSFVNGPIDWKNPWRPEK